MPYVNNQGIRIHFEVEGQGPPLVLVHGLSSSLESWRTCGYVSGLKQDYQLILADVRGHGGSDKPDDYNAYDAKALAEDLTTILDELGVQKAHYFGYSMGAWIGFNGVARYFSHRFNSLILGGFSPYTVEQPEQVQVFNNLLGKGMPVFAATLEQVSGIKQSAAQPDYLQSLNPLALVNIHKKMGDTLSESAFEKILHDLDIPCLIYAGEGDVALAGANKIASKMSQGAFVQLPGLNHLTAFLQADTILPIVKKFLKEVGARLRD